MSVGTEMVIETNDLTKSYKDVVAVDKLTLKVPRGGVFGFLGPNGSGKTTTMGMLLGLVHPTSGDAHISCTSRASGGVARRPTSIGSSTLSTSESVAAASTRRTRSA
jgi:ABC-type multidrug transport system ATPase subunit